jgi:hypothetical protein
MKRKADQMDGVGIIKRTQPYTLEYAIELCRHFYKTLDTEASRAFWDEQNVSTNRRKLKFKVADDAWENTWCLGSIQAFRVANPTALTLPTRRSPYTFEQALGIVNDAYKTIAVDESKQWWKEQAETGVQPKCRSLKYVDANGELQCTGSIDNIRSGHTRNLTYEQKTESCRKAHEGHGQQNHKEAHAIRVLKRELNKYAESINGPLVEFRTQFDGLRSDVLVHFGQYDQYAAIQMKSSSCTAKQICFGRTNGYHGMFMVCMALGPHDEIKELLWFKEALTVRHIFLTPGRPSKYEAIEQARCLGIAKLYTELRYVLSVHPNPEFVRTRDQWVYDTNQCRSKQIARGLEAMKLMEDILGEPIEAPEEQNGPVDGIFRKCKLSFKIATRQTGYTNLYVFTTGKKRDQKHHEQHVTHVIVAVPDATSNKVTSLCVTTPDRINWTTYTISWRAACFPGVEGVTTREQLLEVLHKTKCL